MSVYAKTEYVDGETGEIKTKLNKSGIDIEAKKITISSTGGKLVVDTTNFKLNEAGDVTVNGTINATSGTIGGIRIEDNGLMALSSDSLFVVTNTGELVCSKATIKGDITATSGTFDNCTINETCKAGSLIMVTNKLTSSGVVACGYLSSRSSIILPSVASGEYKKIVYHNPRYTRSIILPCSVTCETTAFFCINGEGKSTGNVSLSAKYAEFHGFYDDDRSRIVWDVRVAEADGVAVIN